MKKTIILINLIILFFVGVSQTPANDHHWQLIWEDNFDYLNTDIWLVQNHFDHYSGLQEDYEDGEPQVYLNRSENVFINNGNLVIKLIKEEELYGCPYEAMYNELGQTIGWGCTRQAEHPDSLYEYTSGWVESKQAYNIQYGYLEARIKLPHGYGFWPAFWTGIGRGETGNAAEIDVFEMTGNKESTVMGTNIHEEYCTDNETENPPYLYPYCENNNHYLLWYGLDVDIPTYTEWRTYAVEWTPSKIIWYVDGKVVRNSLNPGIIDPIRIILNFAITPWDMPNSSTPFPSEMRVDYVRVWQLNKSCDEYINATNYDFSTYDNTVQNFIKIGAGGGNNSLSVGDDVTIRASQFIEISGEFTVPLGASFYADVNNDCPTNIDTSCTQIFNPTSYDFSKYDNSVKKEIILGGEGVNMTIMPTNRDIILQATDAISISPEVIIKNANGHAVEIKLVECPEK